MSESSQDLITFKLLMKVASAYTYHCSSDSKCWVTLPVENELDKPLKVQIDDQFFRDWLVHELYSQYEKLASPMILDNAIAILKVKAFIGERLNPRDWNTEQKKARTEEVIEAKDIEIPLSLSSCLYAVMSQLQLSSMKCWISSGVNLTDERSPRAIVNSQIRKLIARGVTVDFQEHGKVVQITKNQI